MPSKRYKSQQKCTQSNKQTTNKTPGNCQREKTHKTVSINWFWVQMLDLANKDFKEATINIF